MKKSRVICLLVSLLVMQFAGMAHAAQHDMGVAASHSHNVVQQQDTDHDATSDCERCGHHCHAQAFLPIQNTMLSSVSFISEEHWSVSHTHTFFSYPPVRPPRA